jgi:mannose-1-phosphate guanylyltransferase
LASGQYLWNAGVFIFAASTMLAEIENCAPDLHRALAPLREQPRGRNAKAVDIAYRRAPSVPIDVAVMERSQRVWTMPVNFAWSDVGTWSSLADELGVGGAGREGNRVLAGEVLFEDSSSNLVWGGDRLIGLLGVEGLAIIDTEDALLVARLDRSHDLRKMVAVLGKKGRRDLT